MRFDAFTATTLSRGACADTTLPLPWDSRITNERDHRSAQERGGERPQRNRKVPLGTQGRENCA